MSLPTDKAQNKKVNKAVFKTIQVSGDGRNNKIQLRSQEVRSTIKSLIAQCDDCTKQGGRVLKKLENQVEESQIHQSGFEEVNDLMEGLEGSDAIILEKAFEYKAREKEENIEDANQVSRGFRLKQLEDLSMSSIRYQPKRK